MSIVDAMNPPPSPLKPNSPACHPPPKPYTEYTIFFRIERARLLQSSCAVDDEAASSFDPNHSDPLEFPRPAAYRDVAMPPYWYSSSYKTAMDRIKRRKHRKREGRIDLKTLSKAISASWRKADADVVAYCKGLARAELEKYNASAAARCRNAVAEPKKAPRKKKQMKPSPDGFLSVRAMLDHQANQDQAAGAVTHQSDVSQAYNVNEFDAVVSHAGTFLGMLHCQRLQKAQAMSFGAGGYPPITVQPTLGLQAPVSLEESQVGGYGPVAPNENRQVVRWATDPQVPTAAGPNERPRACDSANDSFMASLHPGEGNLDHRTAKRMRRWSFDGNAPIAASQYHGEAKPTCQAPDFSLASQKELRESFKEEINRVQKEDAMRAESSFTCLPELSKEDANMLLEILNVPQMQVDP